MIKVGVIGCGYWGPNYVRILDDLKESKILSCCDLDMENLTNLKTFYPDIKTVQDFNQVIADPEIEAVVVTTPLNTHYQIAKACLENGKHVLMEKPFTSNSQEAEDLIRIAQQKSLVLMVGHVYKYNPAIQQLKQIINDGRLGKVYYVYSERVGLGPIRKHASALWDLATHDLSIALFLLEGFPTNITAIGEYYIQEGVNDIVFVSLQFSSRTLCKIYANWFAPEKVRKTTVVGSKGMAVFDDVSKTESLKVYDRSIDKYSLDSTPEYKDHQMVINVGDVFLPKVEQSEPLKNQVEHFLDCIINDKKPLTDAYDGLNVVKILEIAEESLKEKRTIICQ